MDQSTSRRTRMRTIDATGWPSLLIWWMQPRIRARGVEFPHPERHRLFQDRYVFTQLAALSPALAHEAVSVLT